MGYLFIALVLLVGSVAHAGTKDYGDNVAPKFPKAFYDVNVTQPETIRDFLWVINETYDLMIAKGVCAKKIDFVVSLRGLSLKLTSNSYLDGLEDPQLAADIRAQLDGLKAKGIRIEACDISLAWVGVEKEDLVDGIIVIDNAFASSIYYQRKGFALIPIHQLP